MGTGTWFIVGLGNPGSGYERTPHNAGRIIVNAIAHEWACDNFCQYANRYKATMCQCGTPVLVMPDTYMNRTDETIRELMKDTGRLHERIVVIQDDIDRPFGAWRLVHDGGAGGHHGIEAVEKALGTLDFLRIKMGVAPVSDTGETQKPHDEEDVTRYLLRPLSNAAYSVLEERAVHEITPMLRTLFTKGKEKALSMNPPRG